MFNAVLTEFGFITLPTDPSVYMQSSTYNRNGTIYVAPDIILSVHVDDILAAGRNQEMINAFKSKLKERFQIMELGSIKRYLGLEFEYSHIDEGQILTIHQEKYIENILIRFGMRDCKSRATPLDSHIKMEIDRSIPIDPLRLHRY